MRLQPLSRAISSNQIQGTPGLIALLPPLSEGFQPCRFEPSREARNRDCLSVHVLEDDKRAPGRDRGRLRTAGKVDQQRSGGAFSIAPIKLGLQVDHDTA